MNISLKFGSQMVYDKIYDESVMKFVIKQWQNFKFTTEFVTKKISLLIFIFLAMNIKIARDNSLTNPLTTLSLIYIF